MAAHITWSQMISLKYEKFHCFLFSCLFVLWSNIDVALKDSMILELFFILNSSMNLWVYILFCGWGRHKKQKVEHFLQ